MFSLQDIYPH